MKLTSLCYLEEKGRYLLLHRNKKAHDENQGKWIGVGGKFLPAESPEECLLREVKEETGLLLTHWRFRGLVTFVAVDRRGELEWGEYMHLFTADRWQGELTSCDEGELAWVEKERLPQLPMWAGDRVFLSLLAEERPFFSLKLVYQGEELRQVRLDGRDVSPEDPCFSWPETRR